VPTQSTADLPRARAARLCSGRECRDEALLVGLDDRIARLPPERRGKGIVVFMHQMGSHGPAYFKRSAPAEKRFLPECTDIALGECDHGQLVNAYDNSIVATDRVLAGTIAWLERRSADHATALVYMSDHGESLGELGVFLHGLPYQFAPDVQTRVPYIAWLGPGLAARRGIDLGCVGRGLDAPPSHDNLYHTVLGLLDVTTPTYRPELDTFAACRRFP